MSPEESKVTRTRDKIIGFIQVSGSRIFPGIYFCQKACRILVCCKLTTLTVVAELKRTLVVPSAYTPVCT